MRFWLLMILALATAVPAIYAQETPPIQGESSAEYRFGQAMEFRLDIAGEHHVTAVTLYITASNLPQTAAIDLTFEPARELTLIHRLDLTDLRFAPFSEVTYWWTAVDRRGNEWRSPEQSFEYADDQFPWRQLRGDNVVVHWTGDDLSLGQVALDIVYEATPRLRDIMRAADDQLIRIYIYPSLNDLRATLRLVGRDWVGAAAQPDLGVILVVAANPRTASVDLRQSIPHELSHLLLYQATGIQYTAVPRWFDEGLATFFEAETNPIYTQLTTAAIGAGTTIPFADLCRHFPDQESRAALAYAQSGDLIRFIQAEYGRQALRDLVLVFEDGADCQSATRRALGVSLDELEREWLRSRQPVSEATRFWRQNGFILLILLGGFALTGLLLRPVAATERTGQTHER
jgi:hypothetical protein